MAMTTEEQLNTLMDVNLLSYTPPIDGSLVNQRQLKKLNFQSSVIPAGQSTDIICNSGGDYISGPTSYITLDIQITGPPNVDLAAGWCATAGGPGSAFNIFREFQLSHRSGDVIDRTDHLNYLVQALIDYSQDKDYRGFAEVFGYGKNEEFTQAGQGVNTIQTKSYVFPLWLFSGLFAQQALIPSMLMSGSKMRFQLENNKTALTATTLTQVYSVKNMCLVLDSVDLFDSAKRSLMQQAANVRTQGLQYPYYSWFNLQKAEPTSSINFDMNLSAARTMLLLVRSHIEPATEADEGKAASMATEPYSLLNWRVRLGSLTLPQHEVNTAAESYQITQEAFSAIPVNDINRVKKSNVGVTYSEYVSVAANTGRSVVCVSLEKSTIVNLSGEPTNNSRLLSFNGILTDGGNARRRFNAYIKHLRIANIMLDNVVIDK